ncbi:DUF2721 domain-containing protein [Pontibacter sp. JH31]|uniref:DUF2721 domain-containing protein n=1 Tax=Pontibacter aquaedesilientis TaxID=2766980 RepID=A0ABR7XBH8_9BACT|nr:DUF2721 domain-containing protein [Pontibacter aquaedesilientis]MBD1395654.1 DUF2721 domain-containing protein [Pontibacter aquaedesilientis]
MDNLSAALTILSAMITPAILIMASGSLILTTSQRLSRSMERVRKLAEQYSELIEKGELTADDLGEKSFLLELLLRATRRCRLLQRAMTSLYLTLGVFVATSIAIALFDVLNLPFAWAITLLSLLGAGLLFYASLLLIVESRIALQAVDREMDWVMRVNK